ncbi:non-ribosomal peptide synthetase, partial [Marilutibacter chinensis]
MTLQELIAELRTRGVAIHVDGGELSVRALRGALSAELVAELKAHKPALIALGKANGGVAVGESAPVVPRITPDMLPLVSLSQEEIDAIVADLHGGVANLQDVYPLAPLQEGILFHHLIESADEDGGDTYLQRSIVVFPKRQQLDAFLAALQRVVDRHDILRSAVYWQGLVQPVQVVHRRAALPLHEMMLDAGSPALAQMQARTDPRRIRIDLSRAPLLAAHVARDPDSGEWLLAILNHHMVCDHVTMDLLLAEIHAIAAGREADLPAPLPYRNFIAGVRAVPSAEHEAFFRQQLGHIDAPTAPFGILDVSSLGQRIEDTRIELDDALARRIRAVAQRHGASPAVLFHLAWSQVLARCTGRDEVVFGTVLSGRLQGGVDAGRVVGMFINTLPFPMQLAGLDVVEALADVRTRLIALLAHEHAPLALAQRCSGVTAPAPLFTTLLNYRHSGGAHDGEGADEGIFEGIRLHGGKDRTNYPLTLSVNDRGAGFGLGALAVAEIDGMRMMRYLETTITALVDALERAPQRTVRSLPVLPEAERARLLSGFGAGRGRHDRPESLHALFARRAARHPDAVAVRFDGASLSYGELDRRANRLANRLVALGVQLDDRVAICAERGVDMIVGVLAILKAGGGYVPLDPVYPADRLQYMLADSTPVAVLAHGDLPQRIGVLASAGAPLLRIDDASLSSEPDTAPSVEVGPEHLAYVIYTSGSTGLPKGVMVEHGHVTRLFGATDHWFGFGETDVWTLFHSFAFDFSVWEIWGALLYGGRLVIVPELVARAPSEFYELLCTEGVTVLNQTPSAFRALIPAQTEAAHGLRVVIFGGEALELHTLAPWVARNGAERTRLINMYGITEITVHATYRRITEQDIEQAHGSVIGCAIPDLRLYVLDTDHEPVPVGVIGELYVSGAGVARGYLNRDQLTSERFLPDPFSQEPGARMYRTGDLVRWLPDGGLEYLGRNDFQVKIRGFRIELGEIEAKLAACDGVREAVVIAREDVPGDKRLVAYVVLAGDVSAGALRERLSMELAEYMIPSAFVRLESLPLTPNGKLDRNALPAPDAAALAARAYEAPVGDIETRIAAIWCDLLGLERVGRQDHFFELGGHSLLVIGMIERLRHQGLDVDVRSVFSTPVLAALATRMGQKAARAEVVVPPNPITPDTIAITPELLPLVSLSQEEIDGIVSGVAGGVSNIQDIYPLAPLQEGILFHHLLEQEQTGDTYLLRSVIEFDGRERLDAFVDALQQVIERHDILRSAVHWKGLSRPVQVVHRRAPLPVHELALAADEPVEAQLLAQTDTRKVRLDLNRAPLLAAFVARDSANDRWLLAILIHHIVEDNYSKQLMLKEAGAILGGRADLLPPPVPYRNFIAHLDVLSGSDAAHEAYFRKMLGDVDEPTAPLGALDMRFDGLHCAESRFEFEPSLAARIRAAARAAAVTPSTLFHVAWAQVLGRCSGRGDVVFGTVLSGRLGGADGADRVVGMFLNTLPLRLRLDGFTTIEAVRDAYARMSELFEHEQASLALAQQCSAVEPPLPLFTALMNYRNQRERDRREAGDDIAWDGMRLIAGDARNNYPLTMSVEDRGQGFGLTVLSAPGIDGPCVVAYMETAMTALVASLEAGGSAPLSSLPILPAEERGQVLVGFQSSRPDWSHDRTAHALFEAQARTHPDAEAVRHDGVSLSYAELDARANRLAHRLIALGVGPDD